MAIGAYTLAKLEAAPAREPGHEAAGMVLAQRGLHGQSLRLLTTRGAVATSAAEPRARRSTQSSVTKPGRSTCRRRGSRERPSLRSRDESSTAISIVASCVPRLRAHEVRCVRAA